MDNNLYAKYSLSASEIAFMESIVRPMKASEGKVGKEAGDE